MTGDEWREHVEQVGPELERYCEALAKIAERFTDPLEIYEALLADCD